MTSTIRKHKEPPMSNGVSPIGVEQHPLVGAGLHWKEADGYLRHQAEIAAVLPSGSPTVGDLALITYFGRTTGYPTGSRRLVPLTELASEGWVLYTSVKEMNDNYDSVDQYQNQRLSPTVDVVANATTETKGQIEITPEMIDAGLKEYALFDSQDPGDAVVCAIYRAMRKALAKTTPCQSGDFKCLQNSTTSGVENPNERRE